MTDITGLNQADWTGLCPHGFDERELCPYPHCDGAWDHICKREDGTYTVVLAQTDKCVWCGARKA